MFVCSNFLFVLSIFFRRPLRALDILITDSWSDIGRPWFPDNGVAIHYACDYTYAEG